MTMPERIEISDSNGATVLLYIRLAEGEYYGGPVADWARELMPFAIGPHAWHGVRGILDILACIADMETKPGWGYVLQGSPAGKYGRQLIGRHMDAEQIANALGCSPDQVRERFALVVKVDADGPLP